MLRYVLTALLGFSATANAELAQRMFCIYDPLGANGPIFGLMKDYRTSMIAHGVDFSLRAYTDEKIAMDDFKAQQCDAVIITGARARPFNKFAATIEAIGAVPNNSVMRNLVNAIAAPQAANLMVEGRYEVIGVLPAGPIYLFVRDRNVDTVEELSGKRIATMEYDEPSIKLVNHVGASVVPSNSANFSGKFNNGSVDVAYAPAVAYKPLEMYKGLANNGGVIRYNLAYLDFQMISYKDRLPAGFAQKSRELTASYFDRMIEHIERDTSEIEKKYWVDLDKQKMDQYNEILRSVRIELREAGVYDGRMLRLIRRLRCAEVPTAAECVEAVE